MKTQDMITTLVRSMRIPFLVLTPVSLLLGFSTAILSPAELGYVDISLVLVCALSAHISVNMLNEYYDFRSGLDARTTKTPFSGGSGALIDNPQAADTVFWLGIASLVLTVFIGLYFAIDLGLSILPLGIVGVLIIVTYTPWLNRSPLLCLVAPGIGFGPLMIVGTHLIVTGEYSPQAFWVSLVPFFLASNLLLLNQYPDIEADRSIGRRHFPIVYGVRKSNLLYAAFALAACGIVIVGVLAGSLPNLSLIALLPMALTGAVFFGASRHAVSTRKLVPYMGLNVVATVLTPVFLAISIVSG